MVDAILARVRATPRSLEYGAKDPVSNEGTIFWPCTFGPGFSETKRQATDANKVFKESHNVKLSNLQFKVVPRRAPNLKDLLFKRKSFSLGNINGISNNSNELNSRVSQRNTPCGRPRCKTCPIISNLTIRGIPVKSEGGTCTTNNCVYLAQCQFCVNLKLKNNLYVGKTTTPLNIRINNHRAALSQLSPLLDHTTIDDKNCLWAHLSSVHNLRKRADFEKKNYKFCILKVCDPRNLRLTEQNCMRKFGTLFPNGLNTVNSVSY